MQTCNCCIHSCSPLRSGLPKCRQNSRSAKKMTLYSNLLQRIFYHKEFYHMVNRQDNILGSTRWGHWPWSGSVWLLSSPALTRSSLRVAEPSPSQAAERQSSLSLLPVGCHVCLNQSPWEKDCLSLCVCTAPIARAITGIKVNKSRNGSNLWYRSQRLGRRIDSDKWTKWFMLVGLGPRGWKMAKVEWSSAVDLNESYLLAYLTLRYF